MRPPYHGEYKELRALVLAEVTRDYQPAKEVKVGWLKISVYRRK